MTQMTQIYPLYLVWLLAPEGNCVAGQAVTRRSAAVTQTVTQTIPKGQA
jgi:hypothetical protein